MRNKNGVKKVSQEKTYASIEIEKDLKMRATRKAEANDRTLSSHIRHLLKKDLGEQE